jgi:16S rRNA G966 N2-methylase RsmD
MGVPRFGELIRRKYSKCWFQEGKANVLTSTPGLLDLSVDGTLKKKEVDTLFVDGNGLLHPAMQFTFAYGSFEDTKRQEENMNKTEEQLIVDGTRYFMNAIESLCLEFAPQRLVLAIDGSAPIAKMIQQRQRRFGAKMNASNDTSLNQAWETTLRRSIRNTLQEEGSFVSVTIEFDGGRKDFGEGLINARLELLQPGTPQDKIFRALNDNLVKGLGQGEKVRWYNVLSPETPLGFQFEGKWWYSVAMCATALAWRDVWKQNTYVSMFSMDTEPEIGINRNNKYIYGTGKIVTPEESPVYRLVEEFRRFRANNSDFFVKFSSKIAHYCEKIGEHISETSHVYRETLLMTGIGTNLERVDGKRIEWLMNVRAKLVQRLEREMADRNVSRKISSEEVDYPEYEGGFRGVEGLLHISTFDSNSLTPGTEIMNLIDKNIAKRFKDGKMHLSNGSVVEVLYSSHRVPGEGEHKLENLIDRETRDMTGKVSLVYGLDADLFMLSLVRDYPICMVRENSMRVEKFFGKVPEKRSPRVASCHVVDIDRLKKQLMNVEETGRLIHPLDFTFVCFLFGNDFLRNVPGFIFDSRMQVVFDNKQTKNDEEINPVLFDFVFDVYWKVREGKNLRNDQPLFIIQATDIIKIRWFNVYEYLEALALAEKNILGGLIRRMQLEEEKEKLMTERVEDYVPVSLRYGLLKKSIVERQIIKGGVIDQKAVWIRGIDAFDIGVFEKLWMAHITANIPGYDEDGVAMGLTKSKEDVLQQICQRYMEGMEWAMKYYTNRHSFLDKSGIRKSNLDTRWYYPYYHAPMVSQLKTELWGQIMNDCRRLFILYEESQPFEEQLMVLFAALRGKEITLEIKSTVLKLEKDILDLLPTGYFTKPLNRPVLTEVIKDQIKNHLKEHRSALESRTDKNKIPAVQQYAYTTKRFRSDPFKFEYVGENVFSSRWTPPTAIHGSKETSLLIAPSSTNFKVQLLAVLPQQSHRLFPDGIQPSDPRISWMYPKGIPIDFTFRDRVHASILMIPPPNIMALEEHIKVVRLEEAMEQVREGMFPRDVMSPSINPLALKKMTYWDSIRNVLQDVIYDLQLTPKTVAVDVLGGVGISTMALTEAFDKVYSFESNRENFSDLLKNVEQYSRTKDMNLITKNGYFDFSDYRDADFVLIDLPYEMRSRDRSDNSIRIQTNKADREGTPIESLIEDLIRQLKYDGTKDRLTILIKLPQYKRLKRIVSDLKVRTKFIKDTFRDTQMTYVLITVESQARKPHREEPYGGFDYYQSDPYGSSRDLSPRREYSPPRSTYELRDRDRDLSPRREYSPPRGAYELRDRDRDLSPRREYSPPRGAYELRDRDRDH